ncbi:DNA topology modulation protein [Maricurvus nonylphenolicus]|uniref:adenylate kinase n=1 Tax=Maricurvus nonylphenolicus TaxID=1008307 RepID=UPI0036F2654F
MKKVAIFGNTGGGKSTLAKQLAEATGIPLHPLDKIKYLPGGEEVPHTEYLTTHAELLQQEQWIIDGFGCVPSAWERFAAADTLIYLDLPLFTHGMWVTKRLLKGLFVNPEGWPENSPILKGTLNSYRVLWLCHSKLTPRYRQFVTEAEISKQVHHLRSPDAIRAFLDDIQSQ